MNLYQLASQDEAWGAYALDDEPTPWTDWPAEPPAPVPPGPVPLDAALDAAAREYGVDADVLRALGPGGSVDSIFDTAASLRSRLEAFGGDYAQALASYRQAEEGQGSNIALAAPALADAQTPAPGPAPEQAPSAQPTATTPRPRPARPPASTPVPGPLPSHAARPDQPPAPPDGRLGAADDPRSLLYRPAPAAQKPLVDEVKSQLASGAKTLARMLPGTSAAAHWVATQGEPVASKAAPANVGSVLERVALPTADLPSRDLPLRPETRKAANNAWDAASPQDRQRMQALPGWQGQLARERAAQFAQADKGLLAESPTAALFDTRVEGRTRALIAKGEHPDFAQRAAREGAAAGVAPGQEVKALGSTVQQAPRHAAKVPVPAMTPLSVAQDVLSGALQMGPTAAKGGADIVRLATGDVVGKDFSDSMAARAQTIKDMVGSDRARAQEHNLQVDWADPNVSAMEMLARNKGAVSDKLLPSAGSMLLPAGVATGAGKAATVGRAALALDRTALAARVASAQTAAGIGATAAQNAADVFTGLLDKGHSPEEAYTAAGISVPFSIIAGKLTGGGAETALARQAMRQGTDKAAKGSLASGAAGALNAGVRDGTQEVIEDSGQMVGEAIATDVAPTANEAAKRGLLAFTMGTAMGGGMHAAGATHAPRVQNQATTPQVPRQQDAAANMTGPTTKGTAPAAELARSASTGSGTGNAAPAAGQASAPDMAADPTGEPAPGAATWSDVAAAAKKGRAEAEILRQAAALPEQNAAASTPDTTSRNTPSATPAMAATAAATNTDTGTGTGSTSHTRQRADTSPQEQASSDAGQAGTSTQAGATDPATNAPGAPAPTPSAANAEADASAAEAAPATTQNAAARHTAAAQIQPPATAPIEAQIQALDSGMLVVGGDQATILAHLQAGGVRGAEPFAGVTLVPVDQAALAQQVLSRPLAAPAGPVGTQADRGSQRASAAATLPRSRTAAQLAPAATQAPTAGGFTAGPLTEGRHGSPASAAASQPAPVMEMQRDGTLMVKGDPVQLQERLRQGGVERVLRREGGVLVGLDQVGKARQLLDASQPTPVHTSEGTAIQGSPSINALYSTDDAQRESRTLEEARILQGAPVAVLKGNEAPHGYPLLREWAVRLFQGFGNKATNREIGQVVLDERSVRDSMAHRMNPYKAVAFAAARQVVEQGALVLSAQHGRDTTGHFISAPVSIAGVENIVTVLVRTTPNSQRMYLHSAITKESLLKSGNSGADTADGVERSGKATSGDVASVLRRLLTVNVEVPVASVAKPAPYDATPKFSTHNGTPAPGLSSEQVQELVQQALSGLRNPPPVDIVGRSEEAWIGAPEGVMGAALPEEGRIVIVASAHLNADAVLETLFHEMFHLGVRNVLPSRDYVQSMLDLAKSDSRVQQYAIEWKAKAPDALHQLRVLRERGFTGTELTAQYEALAIEEGLAVVAQELRAQKLAGTRLGMRIRKLANWLASVADRMGLGRLAASIRAMSYNEAERFVMRAIDQAGAVGTKTSHTGQTRFSTRSVQDPSAGLQTDDTNDGTQPLHSMRVEMQRDGTLMVKGDPAQLQERLRQGGVEPVLRREGGVLVGLDQVGKARQLLQRQPPHAQASAIPSPTGQQYSRSAPPSPDRPSRVRDLPSQPATVQSAKAAVAKLTNSMGLLAEGRGRVVVATSADIQAHWQPLVGKVDMGSPDSGLAQGFYDPNTDTVFLIADHIEAGQEMAVAAHELVHKHGKAVLGEARWRQLHEVIGSWANRPEESLERRVYDEAMARVQASRPDSADAAAYSSEELFPYAVQVAMELGVTPTALMPNNSVQGWLARVRAAMREAWDRLTNNPALFDSQDLVDLAFAVAQRENPAQASEFEEPSTLAAPKPGITAQQARDIADKVLKGLGMRGTVTPTIMENPTAAGLVAPESMPSGGVSNGRLYLFLEGIRDEVEGFRVVFHELFHLGLSQSVTLQEYRQTMLHLLADPLVRKYAARWKMSQDGHSRRGSMPVNNWHALAVEEALADMAEEIHHERGGVGTREMADWVRRTIAWMADLAHQWGMPGVARRLRGMTLTRAEAFVVDTVLKARTGAPVLLPDARWATSREEGRNSNLTQQLDEASQEPPTPRLDVSEKFKIKRYDGMTDIDYLDAENGIHGLNAYINRDGILSFEIRAQGDASILGSGTDMFSSLMKKINSENIFINGINGVWELGQDSVNAAEFVQNINAGMTREQAAMSTWTGRIASRYGYTVVLVPDQLGGVQFAYFRRPN